MQCPTLIYMHRKTGTWYQKLNIYMTHDCTAESCIVTHQIVCGKLFVHLQAPKIFQVDSFGDQRFKPTNSAWMPRFFPVGRTLGWQWHCWCFRNPARKPVEVGSLSHYLQFFFCIVVQDFFHLQYVHTNAWSLFCEKKTRKWRGNRKTNIWTTWSWVKLPLMLTAVWIVTSSDIFGIRFELKFHHSALHYGGPKQLATCRWQDDMHIAWSLDKQVDLGVLRT